MNNIPPDLQVIFRHLEENPPEAGRVQHIEVRHDDDCSHWIGRGCDCEPEVETGTRVDRKYGGEG